MIGRYQRGFIMLVWMLVMGFITYKLTDESISFVGRFSGGFAIYLLSVLDVHGTITKKTGEIGLIRTSCHRSPQKSQAGCLAFFVPSTRRGHFMLCAPSPGNNRTPL